MRSYFAFSKSYRVGFGRPKEMPVLLMECFVIDLPFFFFFLFLIFVFDFEAPFVGISSLLSDEEKSFWSRALK